jgi:hypothetical protein
MCIGHFSYRREYHFDFPDVRPVSLPGQSRAVPVTEQHLTHTRSGHACRNEWPMIEIAIVEIAMIDVAVQNGLLAQ